MTIISSTGSNPYTCTLVFQDAAKAKYLNIGDTLEDRIGNTYQINNHSNTPNDFSSGGMVEVTPLGTDVPPAVFASFGDSAVFTPNQVDIRPRVVTDGVITGSTVLSGSDYSYNITAAWTTSAGVQVGDKIADSNGKLYVITVLNSPDATDVDVVEDVNEGIPPASGNSSLFSPTANYELYQGTALTDQARNTVRSRDNFEVDKFLKDIADNSGGGSGGCWLRHHCTFRHDGWTCRQNSGGTGRRRS